MAKASVTARQQSDSHKVTDVVRTDDRTKVMIRRIKPDGAATADMAQWHIVVVLSRKDFADGRIDVSVSE